MLVNFSFPGKSLEFSEKACVEEIGKNSQEAAFIVDFQFEVDKHFC